MELENLELDGNQQINLFNAFGTILNSGVKASLEWESETLSLKVRYHNNWKKYEEDIWVIDKGTFNDELTTSVDSCLDIIEKVDKK